MSLHRTVSPATASARSEARPRHDAWAADRAAVSERNAGLALVPQIAFAAYALSQTRIWDARGYLHAAHYCRQRLQRSVRWLRDQAALGEALARLPHLERALLGLDGPPIGAVVATAIGRVATPETLALWLERARRSSVRALLEEIRACRALGQNEPEEARAHRDEAIREGSPHPEAASRRTIEDPEPEVERIVEIRVQVPRMVRAIFEDVLDLHRAVSGCEAPVSAFVEALVADAAAGSEAVERRPPPHGSTVTSMAPAIAAAELEHAIAQDTRCWADLRALDAVAATPLEPGASRLHEYESMEPGDLERHLLDLLQLEGGRERRIGRMLYDMSRNKDWPKLEFASAGHYAVERLGMARRTAESRVGILWALRRLPVIREAYQAGHLGLETAWSLARILAHQRSDAALQQRWLDYARGRSVKRLRDDIRRLLLLALDGTSLEPPPEPPSHEQWYASLRRAPGDSRERLRGLRLPGLDDTTGPLATLACADVCLRMRLPADIAWSFMAAIEAARRQAEQVAARVPWHEPWAQASLASLRAAHRFATAGRNAPAWVGLVALLEDYVETWDNPKNFPRREWDAIYRRAGFRCEAPCCTARVHIEDHHIAYRSHRGSDEPWNQLALCAAHHKQGEHGEFARCRGKAPLDVIWRLGKEGYESWWSNETELDPGGAPR